MSVSEGRNSGSSRIFAQKKEKKLHADSAASSFLLDLRKCELNTNAATVMARKMRARRRLAEKTEPKKAEIPAAMIKNLIEKKTADFTPCFLICIKVRKAKRARIMKLTVKV